MSKAILKNGKATGVFFRFLSYEIDAQKMYKRYEVIDKTYWQQYNNFKIKDM